ncbi:DUF3306 domain-containing protein [Roseomonas sp. E05]|uniref:DUF3306 domain-containing protein n=1 Tax=Roseomonas sp. E05 TaxID=3046310 RepID=UPI0024B8F15B|nr:DUF3306 domain-containing protein [Roseomonas sp. E05]MDJ0390446.1 DUF3306 domain-containing protein [Roseomonas sp. E05]
MSGEGFLSRWSRRKRGLEAEGPEAAAPAPEAQAVPPEPEFDPASLPSLESLGLESDFSAFLRPQVPAFLRQAALRRMWSLDPAIRDFTGPADYAWDFNAPDGVPGFAAELSEELGRKLAQALGGLPAPEEEAVGEPGEAPEAAPLLAEQAEPEGPAAPLLPDSPLRLSAAEPAPLPEAEAEAPPAPPTHRRHGGAMPV